ncbi:unnamed protein product [Somion occarium]|uniref:Uncharacterized protein n=1 Tax=Somion occarium TaxID=3059160 RepID=A0ABP1CRZ4_9APHY
MYRSTFLSTIVPSIHAFQPVGETTSDRMREPSDSGISTTIVITVSTPTFNIPLCYLTHLKARVRSLWRRLDRPNDRHCINEPNDNYPQPNLVLPKRDLPTTRHPSPRRAKASKAALSRTLVNGTSDLNSLALHVLILCLGYDATVASRHVNNSQIFSPRHQHSPY